MPPNPGLHPPLEERIELVPEEKPRTAGVSFAVVVSLVLHTLIALYLIRNYRPIQNATVTAPIVRYVELMRQDPKTFTEAPGPKVDSAPITAPWSDANRRASMPSPTGDQPTTRPGDGSATYIPPMPAPGQGQTQRGSQGASQQQASAGGQAAAAQQANGLIYRNTPAGGQAAAAGVDWRNALREVGKVASLGGQQGLDMSGVAGGQKGYAESGPLSFETQWYDWGEYAQSMVSRIRVNWYANMPELIRSGIKGVVTIRFTIHRDGSITDVTILDGSGAPPYDFAAKKAIELSSPLNPLPKDFPNPIEHVTAMFFYNMEPPNR